MLDIKVIDYKTTEEFFRGFYKSNVVESYGYQLRRMFDFSVAKHGDYLVVLDDGKPFINFEIVRNNTRRMLAKMPSLAIGAEENKELIKEAFNLIFDYIKEAAELSLPDFPFEFEVDESYKFATELKTAIENFGLSHYKTLCYYRLDTTKLPNISEKVQYKRFIDISVDERYELIDTHEIGESPIQVEKYYQDMLESGQHTEILWEIFEVDGKPVGYILPKADVGSDKRVSVISYKILDEKYSDELLIAMLGTIKNIISAYKVDKADFLISENDNNFIKNIENYGKLDKKITIYRGF